MTRERAALPSRALSVLVAGSSLLACQERPPARIEDPSSISRALADAPAPAAASNPIPAGAPSDAGASFFDDFLGSSIDASKWTVIERLSDQANDELNCVLARNVRVENGLLVGLSKHEDQRCGDALEAPRLMHYTSFQIQQATPPFLYGTIEVRAKVPGGVGIWPVIWMLGHEWQASQPLTANVAGHSWPNDGWCELDIAEFWQGGRSEVNTTVHYREPGGLNIQPLPFDATSRFMVYRLEWSPGSLVWSVDAEDGAGYRNLFAVKEPERVPNVPMYIVINAAIGGTGGGDPQPETFPQSFQVDYVRVTREKLGQ